VFKEVRMKDWYVVLAAVVTLAQPARAAESVRAAVEKRLLGDRTGACLAVAVVDQETVVREYVCADPDAKRVIGADTAFEIGSVTKTMTAALLAELIAQKKAALDDPLAGYLPPGTRVPDFKGEPIRLRHLVTHTSGLPALPSRMTMRDPSNPYASLTEGELLGSLGDARLDQAPGARFEYSNFASMLLSLAVARRAGAGFEPLVRQRLFDPLGMSGAYVQKRPKGIRAADGHRPNGKTTSAWDIPGDMAGVGGVRATLDDMVAYLQAQLGQKDAPVAAAIAATQAPLANDAGVPIAMNWMLTTVNGRSLHFHEGGTGGFSSLIGFDRARGRGVVLLCDTAWTSLGGLADLGLHLMDPAQPAPGPRRVATPEPAQLEALVGEYTLGGLALTVRRKGDALFVQAAGQPEFELGYDSAGDFYPLALDALLHPVRQTGGGYGFTWSQGGAVTEAKRAHASPKGTVDVDAATLRGYEGEYPLMPGFTLAVFMDGGTLYVQGTGQPRIAVAAAARDVFVAESVAAEIGFERDDAGKVVALVLKQGGQKLRGERRAR
jgi:serine-type D-Ala-D-Ala carboxypeptidase/endopeptidase